MPSKSKTKLGTMMTTKVQRENHIKRHYLKFFFKKKEIYKVPLFMLSNYQRSTEAGCFHVPSLELQSSWSRMVDVLNKSENKLKSVKKSNSNNYNKNQKPKSLIIKENN